VSASGVGETERNAFSVLMDEYVSNARKLHGVPPAMQQESNAPTVLLTATTTLSWRRRGEDAPYAYKQEKRVLPLTTDTLMDSLEGYFANAVMGRSLRELLEMIQTYYAERLNISITPPQ